jgi:hypothetical protein
MQPGPFSPEKLTDSLDYLQRIGFNPLPLPANVSFTVAPPSLRRLLRIDGIGRLEKGLPPHPKEADGQAAESERRIHLLSDDVLAGLYGYKIPLAFFVQGKPGAVNIHMGVWSPMSEKNASAETLNARENVLNSVLRSLYPAVKLGPHEAVAMPSFPFSGFVLGIPTTKAPGALDNTVPLDRLIRALSDVHWALLVLAQPVAEQVMSMLRNNVISEIRTVLAAYPATATGIMNPLAQHYTDLLKRALTNMTQGQTLGGWRTGVYLLGDGAGYYRLASLWRGIFSGDQSVLDPVRVWDSADSAAFATNWQLPDSPPLRAYDRYQQPFLYQTLLTSAQLAAYVHLPQLETSGFTVEVVPDFDAVPPSIQTSETITLGKVIPQNQALAPQMDVPGRVDYRIRTLDLTRHVFVAGVTGAGKSNTIFHVLKQAAARGLPFLVIEPAKAEYRTLLNDPNLARRLRIFTLGDETISPFRLNPFEVLEGTPVSVHLDLLRSVFNASFGMWTPLPQIIEQCLHRIYEDRGWDITSNRNSRLDSTSVVADAFPTLTDLVAKVDEVIALQAYEEKISGDLRAALHTRLNGLRVGGKGRMLDVQRSLPMKQLLEQPTVLELEGMGDDDDRAFLIGLLLIRLVEYRRAQGQADVLEHVLVIEEAHRLLANVEQNRSQEEANPRGKAVETFANLLSEIRAYGQSVIVADQVPVKLAPDVIKNTNLKIVHRIVAEDDRKVLAGAMAMNERQANALATLTRGEAVVFSEGDDASVLVQIPPAKNQAGQRVPTHTEVARYMNAVDVSQGISSLFLSFPTCKDTCPVQGNACQTARELVEDEAFQRTFARVILSTIEDTNALDRMWEDIWLVFQAKRSPTSDWKDLLRCLLIRASHWYAARRGAQAGWSYTETWAFAQAVCQVVLDKLTQANPVPGRMALQQCATKLSARQYNPLPICNNVCQQQPPVCLYRHSVADLVVAGTLSERWRNAYDQDNDLQSDHMTATWEVCQDAAYELIEYQEGQLSDAQRRVGLCFAQQMLVSSPERTPRTIRIKLERILKEA